MSSRRVRDERSQTAHDNAVRLIANHRFRVGEWAVAVNPASETNDHVFDGETHVYPDIVARHAEEVVAIGEVETLESISEEEVTQWLKWGEICPRLYLFVPQGTEDVVAELLTRHKVRCAGLRTYELPDDGSIEVNSIAMPNGHSMADEHPWWSTVGNN